MPNSIIRIKKKILSIIQKQCSDKSNIKKKSNHINNINSVGNDDKNSRVNKHAIASMLHFFLLAISIHHYFENKITYLPMK